MASAFKGKLLALTTNSSNNFIPKHTNYNIGIVTFDKLANFCRGSAQAI